MGHLLTWKKEGTAMKVVLIGASGMIGSRILKELVSRGHKVVAVVRDSSRVSAEPGVTVALGDVNNAVELSGIVRGADAVVNAYGLAGGIGGKGVTPPHWSLL